MKYQDVIHNLENRVRKNELQSGNKLPSISVLADELNCSYATVKKAYDDMIKNHLAYKIDQSNYYLMKDSDKRFMSDRVDLSIDQIGGLLDKHKIQQLFDNGWSRFLPEDSEVRGYLPLRETLKSYLMKRKIFTSSHDIVMFPTIKQAMLSVLSQASFDSVLVESTTDKRLVSLFKTRKNIKAFSFWQFDESLLELLIIQEQIKLIVLTPLIHLPTGHTMDLIQRMKLLEICQRHGVYIVEINQFEEVTGYIETQSLFALDKHEMVFHLKTFNHVVNTEINSTVLVSPRQYTEKIHYYKETYIGNGAVFEEILIHEFLNHLDDFLGGHNSQYAFDLICEAFDGVDSIEVIKSDASNFLFIKVPFHTNLETVLLELKKSNITLENVSDYFVGVHEFKGYIVSVGQVDSDILYTVLLKIKDYFGY